MGSLTGSHNSMIIYVVSDYARFSGQGIATYNTSVFGKVSANGTTFYESHRNYSGINATMCTGNTTIGENWHGSRYKQDYFEIGIASNPDDRYSFYARVPGALEMQLHRQLYTGVGTFSRHCVVSHIQIGSRYKTILTEVDRIVYITEVVVRELHLQVFMLNFKLVFVYCIRYMQPQYS